MKTAGIFNLNADQELRDRIMFGGTSAAESEGFARLDLTPEQVQELINNKFLDPSDRQNLSPAAKELLDFAQNHPIGVFDIIFEAYAIYLPRSDYRVSIEGIRLEGDIPPEVRDDFASLYQYANEFELKDDFARAWWD